MKPLAIDCSQICHAAFSVGKDLSYKEKQTGTMFGFFNQIFKLAKAFDTNRFIFCWDSRKRFRRDLYPEYKADRDKKREEMDWQEREDFRLMRLQMYCIRDEILPSLGFKNNFIRTGLEADDLMAYCVEEIPGITLVTSDSDMFQLLDNCEMYSMKTGERIYIHDFTKKYGIDPMEWIDALAISGTHNNVKGIEGAGIIKAIKY